MLFNSIDFAIFLPVVFLLYWSLGGYNLRIQNLLIVGASAVFYGWWDWRFLFLILFSAVVDYSVGIGLANQDNPSRRKFLLWASIAVNLSLLGFFKYFNFFLETFVGAFSFFGAEIRLSTLHIILPVGISFYTFQSLSYIIDVYKKKLEPTRNFIEYSAFVSFFPQLVAGPIMRATDLLPQIQNKRVFDHSKAADGLRQILWGLFKKIVIADNCAEHANTIFNNWHDQTGGALLLGVFFFAFQIYGDFSGYSDIAIGTARLFGINLMRNFAFPYFSRDIGEFWRRWHISLSSWLRDYVYYPLGGMYGGALKKVRNIFILFLVSGLWHGANWTFIAWGAINAIYFMPLILSKTYRANPNIVAKGKALPAFRDVLGMLATFSLACFAWIFFRAQSMGQAMDIVGTICSASVFTLPEFAVLKQFLITVLLVFGFIVVEWIGREQQYAIAVLGAGLNRPLRWALYSLVVFAILMYMQSKETPFIYFQF
jgi:alginate O-acetyltransferase complex protein AlgI